MERLDPRATERISGPSWEAMRPKFAEINEALLSVSSDAQGELTTIYVKYTAPSTGGRPYAVVWLKKSTELVVGFSLPDSVTSPRLTPPPRAYRYSGLTKYLILSPDDPLPAELATWAAQAYQHVLQP